VTIKIAYLAQDSIDMAEQLLGRRTTPEEREKMYQHVSTDGGVRTAERLVEHFRMTGHIAFIEEE
jgi:hypothetical protein